MGLPNENILRRHKSKKPMIITFAIMMFILFLLVSYGYYCFLDYEYVHGKVTNLSDTIIAVSSMTSCDFSLPFTMDIFCKILWFHLSIWYVYVAIILLIFIYMTSRSRNDFKNMEHGSARWANIY